MLGIVLLRTGASSRATCLSTAGPLLIATLSFLLAAVAFVDGRRKAAHASRDAERAVRAAEQAAASVKRTADVDEQRLALELHDRQQGPPPWKLLNSANSNIQFQLWNTSDLRTFDVYAAAVEQGESAPRLEWPAGLISIDGHATRTFRAVVPWGADRRVLISWKWRPDGPLHDWEGELPTA